MQHYTSRQVSEPLTPAFATSLQNALELLASEEQRLRIIREGLVSHQLIVEVMRKHSLDFSWNPLTAQDIERDAWIALARSMIREGDWKPVVGIVLRAFFDSLKDECSALLDAIRKDNGEHLWEFIAILSLLTLDQLEALDTDDPVIRTIFGLLELQTFLEASENANSLSEIFGYWSATPLADLSQLESENYLPFFKAAFEVFKDAGEASPRNLSVLREAIQRGRNRTPAAQGIEPIHQSEQRLREILTFHPGGGQTYSTLWQQAYQVLCFPILVQLDRDGLQSAILQCRSVVSEFRIDEHLHRWKQAIPEHLRKRSEYDRKIRLTVDAKIEELVEFLATSSHTIPNSTMHKPTAKDNLVESVRSALAGADVPSALLRAWMDRIQDTSSARHPMHLQRTGSLAPSLALPINVPTSIQYPRCAAAEAKREQVQARTHLADLLFAHLSAISEQTLLEAFLDQDLLEQCCQFETEMGNSVPPDLERRIQQAVDAKEECYRRRLETLERSIETTSPDELEKAWLLDIWGLFEEQRWRDLDRELEQLDVLVSANASARLETVEAERLKSEIRNLGATHPDSASVPDLTRLLESARKELIERNPILLPIHQLLGVPNLDSEVKRLAGQVIASIIRSGHVAEASDFPALYVAEVFEYLRQEHLRSRNLKETYQAKLVKLTRAILHFMLPENGGLFEARSPLMRFFEESTEDWKAIPFSGEDIVVLLLDRLTALSGAMPRKETSDQSQDSVPIPVQKSVDDLPDQTIAPSSQPADQDIRLLVAPLVARLRRESPIAGSASSPRESELANALLKEDWLRLEGLYAQGFLASPDSDLGRFHLAGWGAAKLRKAPSALSTEEFAGAMALANRYPEHPALSPITSQKGISRALSDLALAFISRIVRDNGGKSSQGSSREHLQELAVNDQLLGKYRPAFVMVFSADSRGRGAMLRALWDAFSSDKRQHETRADLMTMLWHLSASEALAACLTYAPINLDYRKASALAAVAKQALQEGKPGLLQSFFDLKKTVDARPFAMFVDALHIPGSSRSDAPARLQIHSTLNPIAGGAYQAVLAINPRASERPETLEITLPQNSIIRFHDGHPLRKKLEGPFLEDEMYRSITFDIADPNAVRFSERVSCEAVSINRETSTFSADLEFAIASAMEFSPPTAEEIVAAFANFPVEQMRDEAYVVREDDERKIERSLFADTVRSLWITSPRRSGKTTMLYRILDHYSHKSGRSDLVAFFTLNRSFTNTTEFNKWIWNELKTKHVNEDLRSLFENFISEIGSELTFDASVDTFISQLSYRLRTNCKNQAVTRVIYLIDEVDRFATMYFDGGDKKDAATDILWQIRELLSASRDIGFVFAGSAAANRIFVTSSDAPFYNRNIGFELTPFTCDDPKLHHAARQIVEPSRIKGRFVISRQTLQHLLWVCAGIPYYMKLLAGATYAVARQPNLIPSDVNRGLWSLLDKKTGIDRLDGSADIPGSDELRTIALAASNDKTLLFAVVYAAAETSSPLSGHVLRRAQLYSDEAILRTRYHLSKKMIQRGIELATTYGILRASKDDSQEISFGIPFLGEAIARNKGEFWAQIAHELDQIAETN